MMPLCLSLTQDNSTSLLQYLVTQYMSKYEVYSGTDGAQLPLPEPSDVSQAAVVNFDDLQHELNKLHTSLEGLRLDLTGVMQYCELFWPISVGKSRLSLATTGTAHFSSSASQF